MSWFSSFFDWVAQFIERLIELIQALLTSGGGGTIPDDKCCLLARKDNECNWVGNKSKFTCPPGWYKQWWVCCEGTQQIACGECTKSQSSCWGGPWECSIWWYTGGSC